MVSEAPPRISIVIPTLHEEDAIGGTVGALAALPGPLEVLVVDGGSRDRTIERARTAARHLGRDRILHVLSTPGGRAKQMNAGGAAARGAVLLFLHADTRLPRGALEAVDAALQDTAVVGGGFRHGFHERRLGLAVISAWSNLRARFTGTLYGDQAIFVRAGTFRGLGGFRPLPLFEDADLCARMRALGRIVLLRPRVRTSARRFLHGGIARTSWRMLCLKRAHSRGGIPDGLARDYWDASRRGLPGGSS